MGRLHDDAVRTQSRARRPPCRVSAIPEDRLKRKNSPASFRDAPLGAGPESILPMVVMDFGFARFHRGPGSRGGLLLRPLTHPRFPDVGRVPHHALAALAAQQLDRIAIVDVPELPLVDAVAA